MLTIHVPGRELFDNRTQQFVETKDQVLVLEHSLVSLSKWESKWKKPFLSKEDRTYEEMLDYVRCMTITQNVNPDVYLALTRVNMQAINNYIQDPMTATTFRNKKGSSREIITSEIIYYWMIALGIPFECQKWHLNRLLTLINVCSIKNTPEKKMSKADAMNQQRSLNAMRRAKLHSKG